MESSPKGRVKRILRPGRWHRHKKTNPSVFDDEEETGRNIYVNTPLDESAKDSEGHPKATYPRNKIRTSRYTPLTFIPKNLYYQFQNVAYIYFLFIVILQIFPIFGAVNPALGALPLIFVLALTMLKDAIEDARRTILDNELNNSLTVVLKNWHNVNNVDEYISLWRRFKKACSRLLRILWRALNRYSKKNRRARKQVKALNAEEGEDVELSDTIKRVHSTSTVHTEGVRPSMDQQLHDPEHFGLHSVQIPTSSPFGTLHNNQSHARFSSESHILSHIQPLPRTTIPDLASNFASKFTKRTHAKWKKEAWKSVRVGDFVRLVNNEPIPADIVVLSTSDEDGACFVDTKDLDGETNLKIRHSLRCSKNVRSAYDCEHAKFIVECEDPHPNLYKMNGAVRWLQHDPSDPSAEPVEKVEPVSIETILLRGSTLRNTEWVVGMVCYTGSETKVMLNAGITPSKRSFLTRQLNWAVAWNFIILFIMCFVSGLVDGIYSGKTDTSAYFFEYGVQAGTAAKSGIVTFFATIIQFQNLVPISLYITIEIVKLVQAYFIFSDINMFYEPMNYPCTPKTWNISDDLGQIEYVFSDKTGTLTQNVMEFKKCTIGGKAYGEAFTEAQAGMLKRQIGDDSDNQVSKIRLDIAKTRYKMIQSLKNLPYNPYRQEEALKFVSNEFVDDFTGSSGTDQKNAIFEFMMALALCHSIVVEKPDDNTIANEKDENEKLVYRAQSPDEAALVSTARDLGFSLVHTTKSTIVLDILGETQTYKILDTLEFNSFRKRMSNIIQMPDGRIMLYCKGADNVIYDRVGSGDKGKVVADTSNHLEQFANEGLRVLCIASRELSANEYREWKANQEAAAASIANREEKLEESANMIERDLTLLGGTAIEDRLQDGVPDTIQKLADGGIKLWVLTGDRVETAINIGYSCNLLSNNMNIMIFTMGSDASIEKAEEKLDELLFSEFQISNPNPSMLKVSSHTPSDNHALVIDGEGLKYVLEEKIRFKFLMLCRNCKSVICCRVSPSQKAEVVMMVKNGLNIIALAIGDGANDVAMIQAADIGVGIAGEEGRQAVMSSDYAIAQFRFLSRLLIVHGRWCYRRIGEMVSCFFYKNLAWTATLFWYQIFDSFTGSYLYNYSYILLINIVFTSLPVGMLGVLDQDLDYDVSFRTPQLYKRGILRLEWSNLKFWMFMLDGLYQSLVLFFFPFALYKAGGFVTFSGVQFNGITDMGFFVANVAIVVINTYVLLDMYRWDYISFIVITLSSASIFIWTVIYSAFKFDIFFYQIASQGYGNLLFWANFLIVFVVCLLPSNIYRIAQTFYWPKDSDIIREQAYLGQFTISGFLRRLSRARSKTASSKNPSLSKNGNNVLNTSDMKQSNDQKV